MSTSYHTEALSERFSQVIGTKLKKLHMIYGREDSTLSFLTLIFTGHFRASCKQCSPCSIVISLPEGYKKFDEVSIVQGGSRQVHYFFTLLIKTFPLGPSLKLFRHIDLSLLCRTGFSLLFISCYRLFARDQSYQISITTGDTIINTSKTHNFASFVLDYNMHVFPDWLHLLMCGLPLHSEASSISCKIVRLWRQGATAQNSKNLCVHRKSSKSFHSTCENVITLVCLFRCHIYHKLTKTYLLESIFFWYIHHYGDLGKNLIK